MMKFFSLFPFRMAIACMLLVLVACNGPAGEGDAFRLKTECFAAKDERCYAEMTEYTVLKDEAKLQAMRATGKIIRLPVNRKVKVLKRKIDIALVEYRTRQGKRQVWIATKNLH